MDGSTKDTIWRGGRTIASRCAVRFAPQAADPDLQQRRDRECGLDRRAPCRRGLGQGDVRRRFECPGTAPGCGSGAAHDYQGLFDAIPYAKFLGLAVEMQGDELVTTMHFNEHVIGKRIAQVDETMPWPARTNQPVW